MKNVTQLTERQGIPRRSLGIHFGRAVRNRERTLKFAASGVLLLVDPALMFCRAKATNFPSPNSCRRLPTGILSVWPPVSEAIQTHTVLPLPQAHRTPTKSGSFQNTPDKA